MILLLRQNLIILSKILHFFQLFSPMHLNNVEKIIFKEHFDLTTLSFFPRKISLFSAQFHDFWRDCVLHPQYFMSYFYDIRYEILLLQANFHQVC
jgi:hypothetical protein